MHERLRSSGGCMGHKENGRRPNRPKAGMQIESVDW